jgi:hypothetical protein
MEAASMPYGDRKNLRDQGWAGNLRNLRNLRDRNPDARRLMKINYPAIGEKGRRSVSSIKTV